jgi:hypothetical protein
MMCTPLTAAEKHIYWRYPSGAQRLWPQITR